jgi:GTP-binding protein EngB required for normal cell division
MDDRNVDFLSFSDQKSLLKGNSATIVVVDHKTIESKIEFDKEKTPLVKDLAFIGRSNVGKSSLVNFICGLQLVKTSKTPGKTRDLSFIELGD